METQYRPVAKRKNLIGMATGHIDIGLLLSSKKEIWLRQLEKSVRV